MERLSRALRELPLGSRQVLALALEGLTHAEIGETLRLHESAVGVRLHRARAALRQKLTPPAEHALRPEPPDSGALSALVARATPNTSRR
jgi:DNA-directed RNA polymerase specialized sigma24 family protein